MRPCQTPPLVAVELTTAIDGPALTDMADPTNESLRAVWMRQIDQFGDALYTDSSATEDVALRTAANKNPLTVYTVLARYCRLLCHNLPADCSWRDAALHLGSTSDDDNGRCELPVGCAVTAVIAWAVTPLAGLPAPTAQDLFDVLDPGAIPLDYLDVACDAIFSIVRHAHQHCALRDWELSDAAHWVWLSLTEPRAWGP